MIRSLIPVHGCARRRFLLLLLPLLFWGCGGEDPAPGADPLPPEAADPDEPPPAPSPEGSVPVSGAEHLRVLAFVSLDADPSTLLPWTFRNTVMEGGIRRVRTLSVARGAEWAPLLADTVTTPLSRFPWRILPGGAVRLVVGAAESIVSLGFEEAGAGVELLPGDFLAEWTPEAGSAWRIHRASLLLPGEETGGILLDMNRSRGAGAPPEMDWAFLHAGAATQFLFREAPGPRQADGSTDPEGGEDTRPGEAPPLTFTWSGWSRVAFQERDWPRLQVEWTAVRMVERARREVPAAWRLRAAGDDPEAPPALTGELRVVRSLLEVEEGAPGPILPLRGFLEVEGEIVVLGERIPVRGLVRHRQP